MYIKSGMKMAAAVFVFSVVHSLLAGRPAKRAAARAFGERAFNAFYRPFYILQSFLSLGLLWAYVRRLPNRTLYRAGGPAAVLMRLGQLGGMVYAAAAAAQVGMDRITGLAGIFAWLRGDRRVPATPEAQGPAPDPAGGKDFAGGGNPAGGRLKVSGPFRLHRHPLNFAPLPIFWLNPVMSVRLLSYNLAMTVYMVLGSIHEEVRLRQAYGEDYRAYQESGVRFYI